MGKFRTFLSHVNLPPSSPLHTPNLSYYKVEFNEVKTYNCLLSGQINLPELLNLRTNRISDEKWSQTLSKVEIYSLFDTCFQNLSKFCLLSTITPIKLILPTTSSCFFWVFYEKYSPYRPRKRNIAIIKEISSD